MLRPAQLLAWCLWLPAAQAQSSLHFDPSVPVSRQGSSLGLAWAGGLNNPQISPIDLDGDGLKDLLLFDHSYSFPSGHKAIVLLRTSGATGATYYAPTRAYDQVPPLDRMHDWALARDYNCDGKEDLFTYSQAGFEVWKNVSDANGPAFERVSPLVYSGYVSPSGTVTPANLFISQVDLPAIDDIDGDGDLDILTFSLLGTFVEYHKNLSMETYGTCDSLLFRQYNKCWGFFAENFSNNSVTLNTTCQFNVPNPELPLGPGEEEPGQQPRAHAGSTLATLDLDGDGDKDLLLGDVSFTNMVGLTNGGSMSYALMTQQDSTFPAYDLAVNLPVFPAAFHVDADGDGRRDLLVTPNANSLAHDFRSVWYYRNTGTDAVPVLSFQQENLFQDRMVELGLGAIPSAFDENGDGLMDLIVSNHGYYQSGGSYVGKMALLRNVGTATSPAFDLVSDDWQGLSGSGIGMSMHPAFGDVDGDGDLDMYIGDLQGRLHFYRNTATGPQAQFTLQQANITDAGGAVIDVGQFAAPLLHDLDQDGLIDLIVGERNGNVNHYRNTGSVSAPQWTLQTESLGGISTIEPLNVTGHSVPVMVLDELGQRQMVLGSERGTFYRYGAIEGNIGGAWALLDSMWMGIDEGARSVPCLHDFTGDGRPDLVAGNYRGGLSFWRSDELSTVAGEGQPSPAFSLWPNPARASVELSARALPAAGSRWLVHDALGRLALAEPARAGKAVIDVSALPQGVYLVRLEGLAGAQRLVVGR
ncbi:MAG: T9SS type A sorting domain-containing protein [Flavobacteriales bacterium]